MNTEDVLDEYRGAGVLYWGVFLPKSQGSQHTGRLPTETPGGRRPSK